MARTTRPRRRSGPLIATVVAITVVMAVAGIAFAATHPPCCDESDAVDVALVVTPARGSPVLSDAEIDAAIADVVHEGDRLVVVVADGAPWVAADVTLPPESDRSDEREDDLAAFRAEVRTALAGLRARTPEIDLAEAISLAAQSFGDGRRHELYVLASGLQTSGVLSMLDGRLYAEPADMVAAADSQRGIPDLTGVEVHMPRIGMVGGDQHAFTEEARRAVEAIWAAWFAASGSDAPSFAAPQLRAADVLAGDLPFVTPVDIARPQPIPAAGCRQVLGTGSVGFDAGSADLSDADATRAIVADTLSRLSACEGEWIISASASSEGAEAENLTLTQARGATVAAVAADILGVAASDLRVDGWGEAWPCRQVDLDEAGDLLLAPAIANRVVVISKGDDGCADSGIG